MNTLYGISNCDTVKKARFWLEKNQIDYKFVDFRKNGVKRKQVESWLADLGMEALLNKRSTTWKNLNADDKDALNPRRAVDLILEHPTLIKRPLLATTGGKHHVGFKEAQYRELFL